VNQSAVAGFDFNLWVTSIVITCAHTRFKSKMALSESLEPGFNHSIIEEACKNVDEVIALLFPSEVRGEFFSTIKVQQMEAFFFKNLPMSQAWATHLPGFVASEIESLLSLIEKSDKTAAFQTFLTISRIMPLLLIRESFEEVDAMNKQGKWFQAFVVHATPSIKKIHFMGWQKSHDEDIPCDLWDARIRPRSAACDTGPRGSETSEAVKQVYGIVTVSDPPRAAADAGEAPARATPEAAVNTPASPSFLKYISGFGDSAKAAVRGFISRLPAPRVPGFVVELLAFMRVSSMKFSEIFNFELLELVMCESASAFTKSTSDAISLSSSASAVQNESIFSKIETDIIDHGRRFSEGQDLKVHQQKMLLESLSSTARIFTRKVIASMQAEVLQCELTSLINTVFSSYDGSVVPSEQEVADKRANVFHIFRIMSEISEHSSSFHARSSNAALKGKELICRSMANAVVQCSKSRGAADFSTLESQLIALSVATEWLSLTTSGLVQNGAGGLSLSHQSAHPYPTTAHESTHDVCIPGAISLKIHFNKKSETYSEAHCVTFTSSSLPKPQIYSRKTWPGVGSSSKLVIDGDTFTASFHSNGGGAKWGYLFTVTPVFPDVSSLLLLPLRVAITALCFGSVDALLKSERASAVVCSSDPPCPIVSLIDEVHSQSDIGHRFQHLIRGPNSLIHIFKEFKASLSAMLNQAHAAVRANFALPHVNPFLYSTLFTI
jgi:hypothetical protein